MLTPINIIIVVGLAIVGFLVGFFLSKIANRKTLAAAREKEQKLLQKHHPLCLHKIPCLQLIEVKSTWQAICSKLGGVLPCSLKFIDNSTNFLTRNVINFQ